MKLKCTIGSLSCDGVRVRAGEVFEIGGEAGRSILASGYAVEIVNRGDDIVTKQVEDIIDGENGVDQPIDTETVVESKRFDGNIADEPDSSTEALVDLSALNKKDTLELIKSINDPDTIVAFLEQEHAGKNRQDVINVLESKSSVQ